MDRRTALAIGLMLIVAILPSLFIKRPPPEPESGVALDSAAVLGAQPDAPATDTGLPRTPPVAQPPPIQTPSVAPTPAAAATPDTAGAAAQPGAVPERFITVESPLYRYVFSTRGARLVRATLKQYRTFAAGDSGLAQLIPDESWFFEHSLVFGDDTVSLADWTFQPGQRALTVREGSEQLTWVARRGAAEVRLTQTFQADWYGFDVEGRFSGVPSERGLVLVRLGPRIRAVEADSTWDYRSYAVVTKDRSTRMTNFRDVDPAERVDLPGPFEWVALKSRYFVSGVFTVEPGGARIGGAAMFGRPRDGKNATEADVTLSLAATGGTFAYDVYFGPQEIGRLSRIGHDFDDVNPYGWIFRPIIRPIAKVVAQILVWMHQTMNLAYGWVLIVFGIAVRVLLWPLNQKAMKSSIAMQAIQPEINALKERYKNDPQRMQQEQIKLFREHGVNPLGACLPMLFPMPVLFALFFVFRETIEFRGVPFLWLPDLSRADPLYIIPIVMGLSMYALSKIGQIGVPPNPQTKLMVYFMPIMMTVLFLRFAAGLNLYYAVSNIASLPQQWMIAHQRVKRLGKQSDAKKTDAKKPDAKEATSKKSRPKKSGKRKSS